MRLFKNFRQAVLFVWWQFGFDVAAGSHRLDAARPDQFPGRWPFSNRAAVAGSTGTNKVIMPMDKTQGLYSSA
jgi:hypothetical protein